MNQKDCAVCGQSYENSSYQSKYCSKICNRKAYYKRNKLIAKARVTETYNKRVYGLTSAEVMELKQAQNHSCKICGVHESEIHGKRKILYVDHCHATGKVRGLLCFACNSVLGYSRDNPSILKAAITYLGDKYE